MTDVTQEGVFRTLHCELVIFFFCQFGFSHISNN